MRHPASSPARPHRGLTLVELMVGITVGLFITAAATLLASSQLNSNRLLLLDTQVEQDLRASLDIVTRDLRRASYAGNAGTFAALPGNVGAPVQNWAREITVTPVSADADVVDYLYNLDSNTFGFRLAGNVLQRRTGGGGGVWQPLTDPNVLLVTRFKVASNETALPLACPNLCADGTEACWPTMKVRELRITIAGRTAREPVVSREVSTALRVRNDVVAFNAPPQVCP